MAISNFFKKLFSKYLWGNCLMMIILFGLIIFASFFLLDLYTNHGEKIKVPNVVGKNVRLAENNLNDLGIELTVIDTGYIKSLPADIILQQDLQVGSTVKPGRILHVTVNAAHAMSVMLPDLADNSSYREAELRLRSKGFKLTAPKYIAGDRDWVYSIEANGKPCKAGERIYIDQPLTLVIGDGNIYEEYNGNDSLDYKINGSSLPDSLFNDAR